MQLLLLYVKAEMAVSVIVVTASSSSTRSSSSIVNDTTVVAVVVNAVVFVVQVSALVVAISLFLAVKGTICKHVNKLVQLRLVS